jgi:hypothetical protein
LRRVKKAKSLENIVFSRLLGCSPNEPMVEISGIEPLTS